MAQSLTALQLKPYLTPWRRVEIKRRTTTGYESEWQDVSKYVTSWPSISFKTDVLKPFSYRIGSADMAFRSDEKQFSSHDNSASFFSGFLTRYRTLVKISTGLEDEDGVQYPTADSTIFYGLMTDEITDELLETRVPISNISVVLDEFDAGLIASSVTGAYITGTANTILFSAQTLSITGDGYNASGNTISLTGQTLSLTGSFNITGNTLSVTSGSTINTTLSNLKTDGKRTMILDSYVLSQAGYTLSSTTQTISTTGAGPGLTKENNTGTSFLNFRGHTFSTTFTIDDGSFSGTMSNFTLSTSDYTLSFSVAPISVGAHYLSCTAQIISITSHLTSTKQATISVSSYALTSQQLIETIRDYQDSNGNVVLDSFLSSGAWLLSNTGELYIIPTSGALNGKSAFNFIEELALAENHMFYIDRNSNVLFTDREPTGASVYTFTGTGLGARNTNIESVDSYNEGVDKVFTKFSLNMANSQTVSAQQLFTTGDGSASWKYGQREYMFTNNYVTTSTAENICASLLNYFATERKELILKTKYIAPNLDIKDVVTVYHLGEVGGDGSAWDSFLWDYGLWSDEKGNITINNVEFFITGIEIDTNNWFTKYFLKENV